MKKIIATIAIITALIGCDNSNNRQHYTSHIQYVVFYPNYRDTVEASVEDKDFIFTSNEGSNFIYNEYGNIYSNSAPYKVIKNYKEYKW